MKPGYEPKTEAQKMGWLIEECGELNIAIGKIQQMLGKAVRFGWEHTDPQTGMRYSNTGGFLHALDELLAEIEDAKKAAELARSILVPPDASPTPTAEGTSDPSPTPPPITPPVSSAPETPPAPAGASAAEEESVPRRRRKAAPISREQKIKRERVDALEKRFKELDT